MTTKHLPPHLEFKNGIHGLGVFVKADMIKGEVLFKMNGDILPYPTRTSVQIGHDKHIEDAIGGHVNHSCSPTAKVDFKTQSFVCIRDLGMGDEITFDYNESEDSLSNPFECECCGKLIIGKLTVNITA